jgi:hypothetical protein
MSSPAARALYPNLAKDEVPSPQGLRHDRAGISASDAMYGRPDPRPIRPKSPMTYENLLSVPGLRPLNPNRRS